VNERKRGRGWSFNCHGWGFGVQERVGSSLGPLRSLSRRGISLAVVRMGRERTAWVWSKRGKRGKGMEKGKGRAHTEEGGVHKRKGPRGRIHPRGVALVHRHKGAPQAEGAIVPPPPPKKKERAKEGSEKRCNGEKCGAGRGHLSTATRYSGEGGVWIRTLLPGCIRSCKARNERGG
jgi:hypothetical protein